MAAESLLVPYDGEDLVCACFLFFFLNLISMFEVSALSFLKQICKCHSCVSCESPERDSIAFSDSHRCMTFLLRSIQKVERSFPLLSSRHWITLEKRTLSVKDQMFVLLCSIRSKTLQIALPGQAFSWLSFAALRLLTLSTILFNFFKEPIV